MELNQITNIVPEVEVTEIIKVNDDTGELYVPKEVTEHLRMIEQTKKDFDAYEKRVREMLKDAMEEYGVTKIDTDDIRVNYIADSESEKVVFNEDTFRTKYKEMYDVVADDCEEIKVTKRKAHVKVTTK